MVKLARCLLFVASGVALSIGAVSDAGEIANTLNVEDFKVINQMGSTEEIANTPTLNVENLKVIPDGQHRGASGPSDIGLAVEGETPEEMSMLQHLSGRLQGAWRQLADHEIAAAPAEDVGPAAFLESGVHGGPPIPKDVQDRSMKTAIEVMKAADAPYFMYRGSALGLYRDGKNIPGDDDVDIAVPSEKLQSVLEALDARIIKYHPTLSHLGVSTQLPGEEVVIDIWAYNVTKDGFICIHCPAHRLDCEWRDAAPTFIVLPTKTIKVGDVDGVDEAEIPHDPALYFNLIYGAQWRTPSSSKGSMDEKSARYAKHCL